MDTLVQVDEEMDRISAIADDYRENSDLIETTILH